MKPYKEVVLSKDFWCCSKCGEILWKPHEEPLSFAPKFCKNCGEKVDWNEIKK